MSLQEPITLLEQGKPIILKCQSIVYNPQHLYLDGITSVGGVFLSPATTGVYTGTHWMPEKVTDDTYLLRCLSKTVDAQYTYLVGKPDGWVGLGPSNHADNWMYWNIQKHSETGNVTLQCKQTPDNNPNTYLDGLSAGGGLRLSSSIDEHHCGTRWKLGVAEFSPVYARLIIAQHFPTLNIHCFPIEGNYKQIEYATLRLIWEQSDKTLPKHCSGNDIACNFKTTVADWFRVNDQDWPEPAFCGIMWGTVKGNDIQAVNFTINGFGEVILFDPSTGESIPNSVWMPILCTY